MILSLIPWSILSPISTDLHRDIMKMVAAQLFGIAQPGLGGARRHVSGESNIGKLINAVAKGDAQTVRSLCQENKSLVSLSLSVCSQ